LPMVALRRSALVASLVASCSAIPGTINRAGHLIVEESDEVLARRKLEDNPYTCDNPTGKKFAEEDWKVMGANLGGWLVLEPWITPSLFYQFLSSDDTWGVDAPQHTGMDSYTFCTALGPEEANRQLRRHWQAWVREEDIATMAKAGTTHVRIPIGDWMYVAYEPYSQGCWDGAIEELDRVLALCDKYKIGVLLDIHCMKDSQNGFDNSGMAADLEWTSVSAQETEGITTFEHWPIRAAHWVGKFDRATNSYPEINQENMAHALRVVEAIVAKYKSYPAVWGLEPVNEPWQFIPLEPLKKFYWDAYWAVRTSAPKWMFVMHDSFRGYPAAWWDFMKGCPNKAMDSHIYQAWNRPGTISTFWNNACNFRGGVRVMEELLDMPLIVGEWSLATDNCAMWLNGFNDNLPGYPKVSCRMFPCAAPYMNTDDFDQPGAPPSKELPLQGPYGTGVSGPQFGECPVGVAWGAKEDEYMKSLTMKHLSSFNSGHGWFFWNFRTELEPRWSFDTAWYKGWFPGNVSDWHASEVTSACPNHPPVNIVTKAVPSGAPAATTTVATTPAATAAGATTAGVDAATATTTAAAATAAVTAAAAPISQTAQQQQQQQQQQPATRAQAARTSTAAAVSTAARAAAAAPASAASPVSATFVSAAALPAATLPAATATTPAAAVSPTSAASAPATVWPLTMMLVGGFIVGALAVRGHVLRRDASVHAAAAAAPADGDNAECDYRPIGMAA